MYGALIGLKEQPCVVNFDCWKRLFQGESRCLAL